MCTCCRSHRAGGWSPCTGPQKGLLKLLNFRRHVGSAAYPIGGVATFENPDCVIGLRALCVPHCAEWFVTRNALHPYLCREHVPRRLPCRLCRRSDQATARTVNNQKGNDIEVADASRRFKLKLSRVIRTVSEISDRVQQWPQVPKTESISETPSNKGSLLFPAGS